MRSKAAVYCSIAVLTAVVAGCSSSSGGPGVASIGSSASASTSASSHSGASPLAYSECMRSHGVPKFPDPGPNGELQLRAGPGTGIDPESATYKAAELACKSLLPTHSAADAQRNYTALLKYSQCMRSHGIADFPDPSPNGGIAVKASPGGDLDPNSPHFKAAQSACKKYLPDGGKGGGLSSENN